MLVLDGRDGRKKITIKISDFQKQLETSIREVKTNLTNVERNLTNANQTTNALILTTAIKMIEGLDGNKQPLMEWLKRASTLCYAQYGHGHDCDKLAVD